MFYREGLLAPRPTPKLEDHPLSAVHDFLFNLFAATLHKGGRSSIRNLRTRHAVVTGTHYTRRTNTTVAVNVRFRLLFFSLFRSQFPSRLTAQERTHTHTHTHIQCSVYREYLICLDPTFDQPQPFRFFCGVKTLAYSAPIENEKTLEELAHCWCLSDHSKPSIWSFKRCDISWSDVCLRSLIQVKNVLSNYCELCGLINKINSTVLKLETSYCEFFLSVLIKILHN